MIDSDMIDNTPTLFPELSGDRDAPREKKTRAEVFNDYEGFVDKFKPKLTTDDCYTPAPVYEAICRWVNDNIMPLDGVEVVRPFWPGGDYQRFDYPANCLVLDNPPFSILTKIRRWYTERGIRYLLFAPALTCNSAITSDMIILFAEPITYENGATVPTALVTNIDGGGCGIVLSGSLNEAIKRANKETAKPKQVVAKYEYPANVTSPARLRAYARGSVELKIGKDSLHRVARLDNSPKGKDIFGYGWIISDAVRVQLEVARASREEVREEVQAIRLELSDRERAIVAGLR